MTCCRSQVRRWAYPQRAAIVDHLIDEALAHGGRDNVSVVIAEIAA
jgi:serine/threonine protein phosphatase PrpC